MSIEANFARLVESLRATHGPNLQRVLKHLTVEEVEPEFRACFGFWKSLSGRSRNLMLDVAQGRRLNKRF